jgi:hypothetical protein
MNIESSLIPYAQVDGCSYILSTYLDSIVIIDVKKKISLTELTLTPTLKRNDLYYQAIVSGLSFCSPSTDPVTFWGGANCGGWGLLW